MNIHRYYESIDDTKGFLHDVNYLIEEGNKVLVIGLQTHLAESGVVGDRLISHADPLDEVTMLATYSILLQYNVMDFEGNYLLNAEI